MNLKSPLTRRNFIAGTGSLMGSALVVGSPLFSLAYRTPTTVGEIMDLFIKDVPGAPFANTVDTLKSGDKQIVVSGIVTTMFATIDVIRKAITLKANFIIAHEPTFYNHQDQTAWLAQDEVYKFKSDLLKQHNIAVWRNHDYVHSLTIDGVLADVVKQLAWNDYGKADQPVFNLRPAMKLQQLIAHTKSRLAIEKVRYIGDLNQSCQKVLLMPGAAGGMSQIKDIQTYKPDVLVCGEVSEWETAEYVRDARAKGDKLALVVLGHVASEEPGSVFMARWLQQHIPGIKTTHVPAGNSLSFF
jgi:putative NIF3 family GTP cyclohydrolase 1 type 2